MQTTDYRQNVIRTRSPREEISLNVSIRHVGVLIIDDSLSYLAIRSM